MSHNSHMARTHLDGLTAILILGFLVLCVVVVVSPVRALARARDAERAQHVRLLMAGVLQLQVEDSETYESLVERLRSAGDFKMPVGLGDCEGIHGPRCGDFETSNVCLSIREYLDSQLLPELPVDPDRRTYSAELPGYYVAIVQDQIEVGSCGAVTREIYLRHEL